VSVANVPSFLYARDVAIDLPGVGAVYIDVAFGGNFFALARARDLGFAVHPGHRTSLIELGLAVRRAANAAVAVRHPSESHIGSIELPEISEGPDPAHRLVRNAVVFGDGQLDRCPCGTGTSAAMAARHARGELPWASPSTARGSSGPGSEADSSGRSGWATSSRSSPS
jgi:proline racemase